MYMVHRESSSLSVDVRELVRRLQTSLFDGIPSSTIDRLAIQHALFMSIYEPEWLVFAQRLALDDLYKRTPQTLGEYIQRGSHVFSDGFVDFVKHNLPALETLVQEHRDEKLDVFAVLALESKYLLKQENGQVIERPQWMYLRVAIALGMPSIPRIAELYDHLSHHLYTHATPVLFNAGTRMQQLASCFLMSTADDLDQLMDTNAEIARTSKHCGGIGLNISMLRALGSRIASIAGASSGIVPYCRVLYQIQRWINQGGRRPGAMAVYLEPWHADVFDFLQLRLRTTSEDYRCLDLNTALWIPDLFMKRLRANEMWSLFDPHSLLDTPLHDLHGDAFECAYIAAEQAGKAVRQVSTRTLWEMVVKSLQETGQPYLHFKDTVNALSNQANLGTIRGSNLCSEIMQVSDERRTAVCNLASINLTAFVENGAFMFDRLFRVVSLVADAVDTAIDRNTLLSTKAKFSNDETRPMGIGVQGLADVFHLMGYCWGSESALQLDRGIHEVMLFAAMTSSCNRARLLGAYPAYEGSPSSKGRFHWELFAHRQRIHPDSVLSSLPAVRKLCQWSVLREDMRVHGLRNSLFIALMPTVSTSSLLGNNESFEPYTTNTYVRRLAFGDQLVFNRHLVRALRNAQVWNSDTVDQVRRDKGSVKNIKGLSPDVLQQFETVWEIRPKILITHACARAPFVDQSQSLNLYWKDPSFASITSAVYTAWSSGLKTASYYTRILPTTSGIAFAVPVKAAAAACSRTDGECTSCSS